MPKSSTVKNKNKQKNSIFNNTRVYFSELYSSHVFAYVFVILTVIIWGLATPITKATVGEVPPMSFLMLRLWMMAIVLLIPTIYYFRNYHINRHRLLKILGAALIGNVFTLIFYFEAIARTSATEAAIITSIYPLVVSVFGIYILHEILIKRQVEGLLIAFIGILIIVLEPILLHVTHINGSRIAFIGNILILIAVLFDATYSIYIKKYIVPDKIITPFMLISISFIFATIVFTPIGFLEQYNMYKTTVKKSEVQACTKNDVDLSVYTKNTICDEKGCVKVKEKGYFCEFAGDKESYGNFVIGNLKKYLEPPQVFGILYMALFSGILAYTFYNKGLEKLDASKVSVFYYLQPMIAVPVSMVFLGDRVSYIFVIGSAFVIWGIYWVEKHR